MSGGREQAEMPGRAGARVALVTGAARGVGAAVTRRLARDGWAVVALDACSGDRSLGYPLATREDLDATLAACPDRSAVLAIEADARDETAARDAVRQAVERFGGLHAAVAVAGVIAGGEPGWETSEETYAALMEVNAAAVWRLARAAVPALLDGPAPRNGRFVAVASAAGHRGLRHLAAYVAAKHACVGFVRGLAADLGGTGVTANVVSPGSTDTAMLARSAELYGLDGPEAFATHALLGRLLDPNEVAAAVAWVCSPESSALTGTVVHADGGMTA